MRLPAVILVALTLLGLLLLSGCGGSNGNAWNQEDYSTSENKFRAICLNGIEYWVRASGHKGYMAVRIDPETLQPRPCNKK